MSIFSKTCEYALRAVFFIAHRTEEGARVGIKEIAEGIDSPAHFLAKVLQDLVKRGVIQSIKGPNGGFYMDQKALGRPIIDVVRAVDGDHLFKGCALGLRSCSEKKPCPLHNDFASIRTELTQMLSNTSIREFNIDLMSGNTLLKK